MQFRFILFSLLLPALSAFAAPANHCFSAPASTHDTSIRPAADTIPYALLCFYRAYKPKMAANIRPTTIYVNDSLIARLKANTGVVFRYYKEGKITVAADDKGETVMPVKVKLGKSYYFRCKSLGGLVNKRNTLEPVPEKEGREESGILQSNQAGVNE